MRIQWIYFAVVLNLLLSVSLKARINVAAGASVNASGTVNTSTVDGATGSTLTGTGKFNAVTEADGDLSPGGDGIGILEVGDLTLGSTSVVNLQIESAGVAGTNYDQLSVVGSITIQAGATLNLTGAGALKAGDSIVLINNDGVDAISGAFDGVSEGAVINLPTSGTVAKISYAGGDGNDFVVSLVDVDGDGVDDVFELAGKDVNGYVTGHGPTSVTSADTDGDGTLDDAEPSVLLPVASYVYNGITPTGSWADTGGVELNDGILGDLVWPQAVNWMPLVGNSNANMDITFTFPSAQTVDSVTVWAADSDGAVGVALPSHLQIYSDSGFVGNYPVSNPTQTGSVVPLTVSGLGLNTSTVRVVAVRSGTWTMLSEVQFAGKPSIQTNGSIGTIAQNDLNLADDDRVILRIDGSSGAGVDYDQVQVTGSVDLSTAALQLFGVASGVKSFDEIVLIENDGADPIVGRFGGTLAEGESVALPAGGDPLYISYVGGDGNDVTLRYFDPDNDGLSNDVDLDDDGDGISDLNELAGLDASGVSTGFGPTNPLDNDTDRDGINDLKEMLGQDALGVVSVYGTTNPNVSDSDNDGVSDGNELAGNNAQGVSSGYGATNPNNAHSDTDGISDGYELAGMDASGVVSGFGATNPNSEHSDSDGISDDNELAGNDASGVSTGFSATNPVLTDSDSDGLSDDKEIAGQNAAGATTGYGATDPNQLDSDGDGFGDLVEINLGYNPNDGNTDPLDGGLVVTSAADENDGDYSAGNQSLREAIERMKSAGTAGFQHTISFDPSLDGATITLASDLDIGAVHPTLNLTSLPGGLTLTDNGFGVSGSNHLTISGGNLTVLTSVSVAQLNVDVGIELKLGNGGTKGSLTGILNSSGVTVIDRSDHLTAPTLTGSGTVTKRGNNILTVNAASALTGLLRVEQGRINTSSTLGCGVVNNGTLAFYTGSYHYPHVISGAGDVEINSGIFRFNSNQTYTGSTRVSSSGSTTVFEPSAAMATSGIHMASGFSQLRYVFNGSVANYPISGSGVVENTASLTITEANSFSGTVDVKGTLICSNATGSATGTATVAIHIGGNLGGSGSVSGAVVPGGSFFFGQFVSPGNGATTGTLGMGAFGFISGYACDINGAGSDVLNVTGSLDISFTQLYLTPSGLGFTETTYIIAKYGSLTGSFSNVTGLPIGYTIDYAYNDGTSSNNIAIKRDLTAAETWALAQGLTIGASGNGLLSADPNGDGKSNAYHFAFNTDPNGNGTSEGKIRSSLTSVGGVPEHLTLTIPVRDGAAYSGDGVNPTLSIDGIVYTIHGTTDLTNNTLSISEHSSAMATGMSALSAGYSYRTFYVQDAQSLRERAFISVSISQP